MTVYVNLSLQAIQSIFFGKHNVNDWDFLTPDEYMKKYLVKEHRKIY